MASKEGSSSNDTPKGKPAAGAHIGSLISHVAFIGAASATPSGVNRLESVTSHDTSLDEEEAYLAFPDLDKDFLDDRELVNLESSPGVSQVLARVPYTCVYQDPVPFSSDDRHCFMPGQRVEVEVTEVDYADISIFYRSKLYTIKLTHGDFQWQIRRRFKDFRHLHEQLFLHNARLKLPVPTKEHRERRKSIVERKQHLPKFPIHLRPIRREATQKRKQNMKQYMEKVLSTPVFRNQPETLKFFEISNLSFINALGSKTREGFVGKRSGGHRFSHGCCACCSCCTKCFGVCSMRWSTRWLLLKDSFVAYINPETGVIRDVLLMDRDFVVEQGFEKTGLLHGFRISNLSRHLLLRVWTEHRCQDWYNSIKMVAETTGKDFTQTNSHESFAPIREDTYCNWFADAAGYMNAVADALESAKEEILITDWWLSPEIYLKRPMTEGEKWRLDVILKRKACAGVKIFIMLYKEMNMALGINSFYSKQALMKLHPENIKVMRHPDGITLWTHHEKCVVIDQRIAFLGGIDLCYGRWDTGKHRLTDQGSVAKPLEVNDTTSLNSSRSRPNSTFYVGMESVIPEVDETDPSQIVPEFAAPTKCVLEFPKHIPLGGRSMSLDETSSGVTFDSPSPGTAPIAFNFTVSPPEDDIFTVDSIESKQNGLPFAVPSIEVTPVIHGAFDDGAADNDFDVPDSGTQVLKSERSSGRQRKHHKRLRRVGVTKPPVAGVGGSAVKGKHRSPKTHKHRPLGAAKSLPSDVVINQTVAQINHSQNNLETSSSSDSEEDLTSDSSNLTESNSRDDIEAESNSEEDSKVAAGSSPMEKHDSKAVSTTGSKPEPSKSSLTNPPRESIDCENKGEVNHVCDVNTAQGLQQSSNSQEDQDQHSKAQLDSRADSSPSIPSSKAAAAAAAAQNSDAPSTSEESSPSRNSIGSSIEGSKPGSSSEESTENPSSALLSDENANSLNPGKLEKSIDLDAERYRADSIDEPDLPFFHKKLSVKQSEGAADNVSLFRHYLEDVKSGATAETPAESKQTTPKPKLYQSPDLDKLSTSTKTRMRQMWLRKKRPPDLTLDLQAVQRPKKSMDSTASGTPLLEAGSMSSPFTDQFLSASKSGPKPSTPKPRRKITQKAFNFKVDMKERFRKRSSKSVDMSLESDPMPLEPGMYHVKPGGIPMEKVIEDMGLEGSSKLWIGKDYCNFIFKDFVQLDRPFKDFIDRNNTPRMPWHDIGAVVYGRCARDVTRHFIQRWNFGKLQKRKTNDNYPFLLPKSYQNVYVPPSVMNTHFKCRCQILRSSAKWSAGIKTTESSIHNAYVELIKNSKHYLYIENQFFISVMDNNAVKNSLADAIFDRIIRAHNNGETFRVFVIMPLLPAFEGELGTSTGTSIQAVIHWNYQSIAHGGTSLLESLAKTVGDPFKYLSFFGLRTHSELSGNLVTELIYVHSKLMIVDDEKVIIGSANINDRSLLGDRDSELAVYVEDTQTVPSLMNGERYRAGWYASTLRKTLFREHLGLTQNDLTVDITDPVSNHFYKQVWLHQAAVNTSIYEKVFNCVPTDDIRRFDQLRQFQEEEPLAASNPQEARNLLEKVKGHLVLLPLQFLADENLQPKISNKEGLVPTSLWT